MEKITLEEHKKIGRDLKVLNRRLIDNLNESQYKLKKDSENSHEKKAIKLLSELRDHMEEIFAKDHRKDFSTGVYYGNEEN